MSLKVLVIGGSGLLGAALMRELAGAGVSAVAVSRRSRPAVDVTLPETVAAALREQAPDAVILAAAQVDVDGLEAEPDRAFAVNALGARNVAEACRRADIHLCYVSTDFVFDGQQTAPYTEFDAPHPLSVYGRSKLAGEQYVLTTAPGSLVVRTSGLFGPDGPCFAASVLRAAKQGKPLRLIHDRRSSPTSTRQAARGIVRLMQRSRPGIYHVAGRGDASPLEFGLRLLAAAGLDAGGVTPIPARDWQAPAPRPAYSVLRRYLLELEGDDDMECWEEEADCYAKEWIGGNSNVRTQT